MGTSIAESETRFRGDPAAAQATPTVTATLINGRARLTTGNFNWESDLPAPLGGGNLGPSPTAYLLGALAGCAVAFLWDTLGPQFGVALDDIRAVASCRTDARGLLGFPDVSPALADVRLEIEVSSSDPDDRVEAMLAAWRERCPIYLALLQPNAIDLQAKVVATAA